MDLDVLIVTHHRTVQLARCLEAIQQASLNIQFTISTHVLVNGTDLESTQLLQKFKQANPNLYFYHEPKTQKPGLARNILLNHTTAEWIFFIDDDAYPNLDIFTEFQNLIKEHPTAVLFGGPNVTPTHAPIFQKLSGLVFGSLWGAMHTRSRYFPIGELRLAEEAYLSSCNLFVHKSVFETNKYPDHYRTAEESYLILNILNHWRTDSWYAPTLLVYHDRRSHLSAYIKQIFGYAAGRGHLIFDKKTCGIVYFIPSLFLFMLIAASFNLNLRSVMLPLVSPYIFITTLVALYKLTTLKKLYTLWLLFLYPITHLSYAMGLVFGILRPMIRTK